MFANAFAEKGQICLTASFQVDYEDLDFRHIHKIKERTESSESFQKLSSSYEQATRVAIGGSFGFEGMEISDNKEVEHSWKTANENEMKKQHYLQTKLDEDIEYGDKNRQLFKKTTVSLEIQRQLKGHPTASSIASTVENQYKGPVNQELCPHQNAQRLLILAQQDIKNEKAGSKNDGKNIKISGPLKNRLEETKCGEDRK